MQTQPLGRINLLYQKRREKWVKEKLKELKLFLALMTIFKE
ncbi:hypothetical protein K710_1509 [Streptococcus iniae SF1]|nr:hypothetical protein K710_1509 [Streptococcus iniae SF1]